MKKADREVKPMNGTYIALFTDCCATDIAPRLLDELKANGIEPIFPSEASGLEGSVSALKALGSALKEIQRAYTPPYFTVIVPYGNIFSASDITCAAKKAQENPDALIVITSKKARSLSSRLSKMTKWLLYRHFAGAHAYGDSYSLKAFSDKLLPELLPIPSGIGPYSHEACLTLKEREPKTPVITLEADSAPTGNERRSLSDMLKALYRRHKSIVKFSLSSFSAFVVDYTVFSLIMALGEKRAGFVSLTLANIIARAISSTMNFTINRRLVFKSTKSLKKSAAQFYTLAAIILAGNSLVLNFLAGLLGINHYLAKIMTEMIFFLFNFTIQSLVIFKNKN